MVSWCQGVCCPADTLTPADTKIGLIRRALICICCVVNKHSDLQCAVYTYPRLWEYKFSTTSRWTKVSKVIRTHIRTYEYQSYSGSLQTTEHAYHFVGHLKFHDFSFLTVSPFKIYTSKRSTLTIPNSICSYLPAIKNNSFARLRSSPGFKGRTDRDHSLCVDCSI